MPAMTRTRWWILTLLFFITTINYLDRIVLSVLIPVIREDLHITTEHYGYITGAFQLAYTIGFLFMGRLIDRYGTRFGYAVSIAFWSAAAMLHALAQSTVGLGFWRAMLGLGESGNFPAAVKAVTEWFPKKDRALATGLFNAGTNVASMVGPPIFVWMNSQYGWRASFAITGGLGFFWLILWLLLYRLPEMHQKVNQAELDYIRSDGHDTKVRPAMSWGDVLRYKQTYAFALAKFLTDPVWWFYLFWLPPYLYDVRKFNLTEIAWALPVIYLMADFGSVAGGWVSGHFIRIGWTHARARKVSMAMAACVMPVAATAVIAPNAVLVVLLVSLATAGHQAWSANLYTTTTDVFPKRAVASVTGIGGCAGGLGGVIISALVPGFVITHFGYKPVFLLMGVLHLISLFFVHRMMGDMRPVEE
jgi:ACS family hexuronate transporter-like MFS transporter